MITWGQEEQRENREVFEQFDNALRAHIVAHTKCEWQKEDYDILGKARAFSEARYAVRFLPLAEAICALEHAYYSTLSGVDGPYCGEADALKGRATVAELRNIIDQLKDIRVAEHGQG